MTEVIQLDSIDQLDGAIQGVLDEVSEAFENIDYTDTLTDQLKKLENEHGDFFHSRSGPDGEAWPPNAPSTKRKKGQGIQLFEGGSLRASLMGSGGDAIRLVQREGANNQHGLVFGTSIPYSMFNQEGTVRIPARPHVGMTGESLDRFVGKVADATVEAIAE